MTPSRTTRHPNDDTTRQVRSVTARKILFNILGTIFVGLGIAGIILPLLPATPFFLLASACYLRGSERLHSWLMNHRYLGSYLRNYQEHRAMPMGAKIATLIVLWISIGFSIVAVDKLWVRIILVITALCTTTYILRLRTLVHSPQMVATTRRDPP
ncbi:MAG: YbaN family protein [bacterium]|nr:YbaN family protein [Candidatus Kapabacteria bacterium]